MIQTNSNFNNNAIMKMATEKDFTHDIFNRIHSSGMRDTIQFAKYLWNSDNWTNAYRLKEIDKEK